jgi:F420-dependent oxidoreductase-like protein
MNMKLGININYFSFPKASGSAVNRLGPLLGEIAQAADQNGFDIIGVADHLWQHPYFGGPEREELEAYTTLGFLAAYTKRARLMAFVTAATFRSPGLLAKMVTTLDILTQGRAWLGIGAGHYEEEARGLGISFPPLVERYEILEETLQICLQMWSGEKGTEQPFQGRHYQLERPLNSPQSLSRPHPPILIGGSGEQKTLRLVARYADACNIAPSPELEHKLQVLREHCAKEGREYDQIEKTSPFAFELDPAGSQTADFIGKMRWLAGMGIQTVIGSVPQNNPLETIEYLGREVIPAIESL